MSATPTDPPARRRLWIVPDAEPPGNGFRGADDGYWCSCRSSVLPSPDGGVELLEIDGELDMASLPEVVATVERALSGPADHIVIGLSGMVFCGVRGAALLLDTGADAARRGIGYSVGGAPFQLRRLWSMLFPAVGQPRQFATVERALTEARTAPGRRVASLPTDP